MRILMTTAAAALTLSACATANKTTEMNQDCETRSMAVFFQTGSNDFDAAAKAELDGISNAYRGCDIFQLKVAGYADSVGNTDANMKLSDSRAKTVFNALMDRGVTADRIKIESLGERTALGEGSDAFERRAVVTLFTY